MTVTLDKAGRVILPKRVRDELGMQAGDEFELESSHDGVHLKPVRSGSRLSKKQGVWVFRGSRGIPSAVTDRVLDEVRESRDRLNRGGA